MWIVVACSKQEPPVARKPPSSEQKVAPVAAPIAVPPVIPKPIVEPAFAVSPGVARGVEGLSFRIPNGAPSVRLNLKLRNSQEYTSYRVLLETAQADGIAEYNASKNPLRVSIPAAKLRPGDYVLLLRGRAEGGREEEMDDYHFTVLP